MTQVPAYLAYRAPAWFAGRMDKARQTITRALADRPSLTMKQLSRDLGLNDAYVQQFVKSGKPKSLPEGIRVRMAEMLDVSEADLGAPERAATPEAPLDLVMVPQHDARFAAGPGDGVEVEGESGKWPFPADYIRYNLALAGRALAVEDVIGDSMEPTLFSGDKVLIDLTDRNIAQPGIFALNDGDGRVVKRLEKVPTSDPPRVVLMSDNPRHGRYEVLVEEINVAGRVVWVGRKM